MVARIATGKNIRGILHYNEQKVQEGLAELLHAAHFLQDPAALGFRHKLRRFERLQEKAPRVKTNALHISLNFHPGEELPPELLTRIAASYMEGIGFGAQPYLVYRHRDAAHPHLHIVTTNITKDGERLNLHDIGRKRSEPARKAIEQEFGLLRAGQRTTRQELPFPLDQLEQIHYGTGETRRSVARVVTTVLSHYNVTSLAELNAVLGCFGVTADRGPENTRMHRRNGLVYSILDKEGQKTGVPLKASSLPGKPTLAHLERRFLLNEKARNPFLETLRQQVDLALQQAERFGTPAFLQSLNQAGVQVLFRRSTNGSVYGITYLDHRHRAVINSRQLGRGYGAKHLLARLAAGASAKALPPTRLPEKQTAPFPAFTYTREKTNGEPYSHTPADILLRQLLEANQLVAYLPAGLKPRKQKRKKRNHLL